MKTAVITGITGQDGAYLAKFLITKGYRVVGLVRSCKNYSSKGLEYLKINEQVHIRGCDLTDLSQVITLLNEIAPEEIYNLAAQSSVSESFNQPIGTIQFNIISVLNILEAIRMTGSGTKFYQASSSEMFGKAKLPIKESTPLNPISPYSISKTTAHLLTKTYREAYGIFGCCGILFNHESFLRSENFFIKKIILGALKIKEGKAEYLRVGNIDIKRDFGWAPKYVEAMYFMLQQSKPNDFIICSNRSVSLRSIIEFIFDYIGITLDKLVIDQKLNRPTEIPDIYGDSTRAKELLNWDYQVSFFEILIILIEEELCGLKNTKYESELFSKTT